MVTQCINLSFPEKTLIFEVESYAPLLNICAIRQISEFNGLELLNTDEYQKEF